MFRGKDEQLNQQEIPEQQPQPEHVDTQAERNVEQPQVPHEEIKEQERDNFKPSCGLIALFVYLYFIQGLLLSIPATMPFVYKDLPNYTILSLFSFATVPFSFKFLLAPFIQKYTSLKYGKRKTWIMITQIGASIIMSLASFFTAQDLAVVMVLFMFLSIFFICIQSIAVNALAIKQLRRPNYVAIVESTAQMSGITIGSLLILKLTSSEFASQFGLSDPITTPTLIFRVIGGVVSGPIIFIHCFFKETLIEGEVKADKKSLWEITKYYRVFLDRRSRFCRTFVLFLVYQQGFNLFWAGYQIQLVKTSFSKNTLNTILNICHIPASILTFFMGTRIQQFGVLRGIMVFMVATWFEGLIVLILFPTAIYSVALNTLAFSCLNTFNFMLTSVIINTFPVCGLSGMFVTMLGSGWNFGQLKAPQLKLTGAIGWLPCAIVGLAIQAIIIAFLPKAFKFCQKGRIDIDSDIMNTTIQDSSQLQQNGPAEPRPPEIQMHQIDNEMIVAKDSTQPNTKPDNRTQFNQQASN